MPTETIWVCQDCMFVSANGESEGIEPDAPEPLGLLIGLDVSLGMMPDDHHEDCDFRVSQACGDEGYSCNLGCEEKIFSSHRCQGCGSQLAGSRHAMTIHTED